ncbi:MAG: hypothetical protein AB1489_43170, partial [Acidobacteriota bacterium]
EFQYDLCDGGTKCGNLLPEIKNLTNVKSFAIGSALVPLNLVHIYARTKDGRTRIYRNDGGSILPISNGVVSDLQFEIVGGTNSVLGEVDSFKVSYLLADGSQQPAPTDPRVPWLNQVKAIKIEISMSLVVPSNKEVISRSSTFTFPIAIKNLD